MIHLLHLKNQSIFSQLQLEEALLRANEENWCLISEGSSPAVVMGISGKAEELIDLSKLQGTLIRRFSGGGTVVVDESTLFVTFIFNKSLLEIPLYPDLLLRWSESFYRPLFPPSFALKENDYVLGEKKCGGNAQYLRKDRWLHHTSFLWDLSPARMEWLLHPKKQPRYRQERSHLEFLCRLRDFFSCKEAFIEALKEHLKELFPVKEWKEEDPFFQRVLAQPHRQATTIVESSVRRSPIACDQPLLAGGFATPKEDQ